jgi:hypothetical protein
MSGKITHQLDWAAVKENRHGEDTPPIYWTYDIWTWNVYKLKWTRMSQHGSGFGSAADALVGAKEENDRTANMLRNNKSKPRPI